jgi:hypothetical protein
MAEYPGFVLNCDFHGGRDRNVWGAGKLDRKNKSVTDIICYKMTKVCNDNSVYQWDDYCK